jgi:hypothetical protein
VAYELDLRAKINVLADKQADNIMSCNMLINKKGLAKATILSN